MCRPSRGEFRKSLDGERGIGLMPSFAAILASPFAMSLLTTCRLSRATVASHTEEQLIISTDVCLDTLVWSYMQCTLSLNILDGTSAATLDLS
jgi:hypothetical protein